MARRLSLFCHQTDPHFQALRPDLVLLDLNLPRLKGHDVLGHMKGDALLKTIPVVILTTSTNPADIATSYELKANSYLKKSEEWDAFEILVRSLNGFWITHATSPDRP